MRAIFFSAAIAALTCGTAFADCKTEIEKTKADWAALKLTPSKPGAPSKGIRGHEHITAAVDSMRFHLAEAEDLCDAGNGHEALLHLNLIRAFLDLPEFQHPTSHFYLYKPGKK
ncbi:hypothetical protein [Methylocystis echinoides]|uniref:Uncharacterized protein n=1 Tax=Methylocystis echinoides TaxID=29468 RepID=A0A9W6LTX2_9HYPH|nr:hypothetical protein [Methylocystis echinoides]RTL81590.1 MAG: hypothetical protein EKK29_17385 [Hyphomicrobiales bacterium]GLI95165.1 hypothetical protein LMG27198_41570 [Methylocystis echinoides]